MPLLCGAGVMLACSIRRRTLVVWCFVSESNDLCGLIYDVDLLRGGHPLPPGFCLADLFFGLLRPSWCNLPHLGATWAQILQLAPHLGPNVGNLGANIARPGLRIWSHLGTKLGHLAPKSSQIKPIS